MTGMIDANTKDNERGLLPYPIILAASKGELETMKYFILHYGSYMTSLSMRKLRDEQGSTYWGIDEETCDRLRSKLMQSILAEWIMVRFSLSLIIICSLTKKARVYMVL